MADKTKKAQAENTLEQNKANIGNNPSAALDLQTRGGNRGGRGNNGYGNGNGNGSGSGSNNSNSGTGNGNGNGGGSKTGGSSTSTSEKKVSADWEKKADAKQAVADKHTEEQSSKKGIDAERGKNEVNYISLGTLKRDKDNAELAYDRAVDENKRYQELMDSRKKAKGLAKAITSGLKKGYDQPKYTQEDVEKAKQDAAGYFSSFDGLGWTENDKDFQKQKQAVQKQVADMEENVKRGEEFKNTLNDFQDLMAKQGKLLGWQIDEYGKWAEKGGTPDNKYQAEAAMGLFAKLNQIYEDGQITEDEVNDIESIYKSIDTLAEEELRADQKVQDAKERYDSASAKYSYYLFDQIRAWAIFAIGLSTGNAQMVYSAMDQFNKRIADSEASFAENRMNAFSNNDVKETTGDSDVAYAMKMIAPEIEKAIADGHLEANKKAWAMEGLEQAFEEYQRYTSTPGHGDFAAWYTMQEANGNDWFSIVKALVGAGALNWDSLRAWFTGGKEAPKPNGKDTGMNTQQAPDLNGILGNGGKFTEMAKGVMDNAKKQSEETKIARDKASVVGNALASRMGGQASAPQGTGNAAPVNTSWGKA